MGRLDEEIRQARVRCRLPPESKVLFVPLIGDEAETWLEFKKLDEGNPITSREPDFEKSKKKVDLQHPIVPLVGKFAVDAFNELCMLFIKKNVSENLHDVEIVKAKYVSMERVYIFLITLEGVEEDVVGVYEARVICYRECGMKSLIKLIRTLLQPAGKKAETSTYFIGLKSKYQDVQAEMKLIKAAWKARYEAMKADWSRPTKDTWLIVRPPQHHACRGYDYESEFPGFDLYMHLLSICGGEPSGWDKPF